MLYSVMSNWQKAVDLEDISHTHKVSLMYKLKDSAQDTDDLSIGFHRSRDRRKQVLTSNKNTKVNIILELCSKM